ncbi:MAG TPA: hypothetical protein VFF49_11220 [Thermodesulfobacteriota bacterium]|nr:hypothetical protein [Thermodesulfobacteriota bacterium]
MKVTTEISKRIKVREGKKYVVFTIDSDGNCEDFDSNMPYKKSISDWVFYSKAISKMIKEIKKYD